MKIDTTAVLAVADKTGGRSHPKQCAGRAMKADDTIVIKAPAGTKARWVRLAGGEKLSAWVVSQIDQPPDPERYLARFARKEPGSVVMLTEEQLRDVMRKAYYAGAYRA